MSNVLLLDGDIILFQAAHNAQTAVDWGDGIWSAYGDENEARERIDTTIAKLRRAAEASKVKVALSWRKDRWREDVMPGYKSHRGAAKPLVFWACYDYLQEVYHAEAWPRLEGDDVLGIWSTGEHRGEGIVWSTDKDLKTIPGRLMRDGGSGEILEISRMEADMFHLAQALAGDKVDGYSGCPKIGDVRAPRIIQAAMEEGRSPWEAIVKEYEKQGLSEADALANARVARILREGEYDQETNEVELWTP